MKELTDENFRELYRPVVHGAGFITDASRRRVVEMIKKQNFLAFNPLQFNIFYLAAFAIIVLFIGAAFISNNVGKDTGSNKSDVNFHTLKREEPAAKPAAKKLDPPKKTESVTAPVATPKTNSAKPTVDKPTEIKAETPAQKAIPFAGVIEAKKILKTIKFPVTSGIPIVFAKPDFSKPENTLLPKMPDSLPPQKKIIPRVRPQVVAPVTIDTAKRAPKVKPDTSVVKVPANTSPVPAGNPAPATTPATVPAGNVQAPAPGTVPAGTAPATITTAKPESKPATAPVNTPEAPTKKRKK